MEINGIYGTYDNNNQYYIIIMVIRCNNMVITFLNCDYNMVP